jgi:hypothetical protein
MSDKRFGLFDDKSVDRLDEGLCLRRRPAELDGLEGV